MKDNIVTTQGIGSKMRIKLFDPKTNLMLSDRLVEQPTEFMKGPLQPHKGPLSIECNLYSQTQVNMLIDYLKKLKGDLPIEEKVKKDKTAKTINKMLSDKEPLLDLIKTVKAKAKNQEGLVTLLREYEFMFLDTQTLEDTATKEMITLRDKDKDFQWMVRRFKKAKDPSKDKFDFRLVFGIKILGERVDKVPIYLWATWSDTLHLPWEERKKVNFKKVEKIWIFPAPMDYADRKKWRLEHRKWEIATKNGENPDAFDLSKFYTKWKPYIKVH